MGEVISQRELRNDSAEVLRRVEAGESLTVTRRGQPVADLVPHRGHGAARRVVPAETLARAMRELPPWQAADFDRELRELDARLDDAQHDPWQ